MLPNKIFNPCSEKIPAHKMFLLLPFSTPRSPITKILGVEPGKNNQIITDPINPLILHIRQRNSQEIGGIDKEEKKESTNTDLNE